MNMSDSKKPKLPDVDEKGQWMWTVHDNKGDFTYQLREATIKERDEAIQKSGGSQIRESAELLATVTKRKKPDGTFESLVAGDILAQGERHFHKLLEGYAAGLIKLEELTKSFLEPCNEATSATQKSEASVRP